MAHTRDERFVLPTVSCVAFSLVSPFRSSAYCFSFLPSFPSPLHLLPSSLWRIPWRIPWLVVFLFLYILAWHFSILGNSYRIRHRIARIIGSLCSAHIVRMPTHLVAYLMIHTLTNNLAPGAFPRSHPAHTPETTWRIPPAHSPPEFWRIPRRIPPINRTHLVRAKKIRPYIYIYIGKMFFREKMKKIEAVYQLKKTSDYSQNDPPGPEQKLKKTKKCFRKKKN